MPDAKPADPLPEVRDADKPPAAPIEQTDESLVALLDRVADPDGDASPPRWRVDGVLLAPGTSSITITQPHTIEAQVRDARGATTTSKKSVTCN